MQQTRASSAESTLTHSESQQRKKKKKKERYNSSTENHVKTTKTSLTHGKKRVKEQKKKQLKRRSENRRKQSVGELLMQNRRQNTDSAASWAEQHCLLIIPFMFVTLNNREPNATGCCFYVSVFNRTEKVTDGFVWNLQFLWSTVPGTNRLILSITMWIDPESLIMTPPPMCAVTVLWERISAQEPLYR